MKPAPTSFYRYLPADSSDREWGIYATSAGFVDIAPGMPYPPPGHPREYAFIWERGRKLQEIQIHLILRGSGSLESGPGEKPKRQSIETGDVFVLLPDIWHRYSPRQNTGWLEYWIGLKGDMLKYVLSKRFFSPGKGVYRLQDATGILNLFTEAISCLRAHPAGTSRIIGTIGLHILAKLHASTSTPVARSNRAEVVVEESKHMLAQDLEQTLELELLAKKLGVGYHWLRRTFKQQTGMSLHQYRLQARINRSKQLLIETDLTIEEIAMTTGFESPYYFSHLFKAKLGDPPTRWRVDHKEGSIAPATRPPRASSPPTT